MIAVELEGYRIVRPLGEGGMGTVLLAEELALERLVAIKVIREELGDARMIARFRAEARALARLTHPNVVQVFHVGEVQGRPYIVYEHVPGLSLDRLGAPRPWTEVLDIGVGLARGLAAVHRVSLLHRDIKPANVMLSEQGVPKLIDFGLARPSDGAEGGSIEGMLAGTPEYMAPELLAGGRATMRSDVFALGLILRELLTGEHLRRGLSLGQLMGVALRESIAPPAVGDAPAGLVDLLARCLRRDPAERCASAAELRDGLELLRDYHRVFAVRGDTRGAHPSFDRVTASFARMGSSHDALVATFYERLFERGPQLRALFPASLEPQRAKLLEALRATIGALEAPERVAPMLVALGRRHARYGVVSAHLAIAGDALLDAVRAHDAHADDEVIAAWRAAWELVSDAFARGLHDASTPPPIDGATSDTVARTMVASSGAVVAVGGGTPLPVTRFADVGGATIAWQVEGTGAYGTSAGDVVLVPGFVSNLEVGLSWPPLASLRRGLADEARLVMLDLLGNGLSERVSELPSIGEWAEGLLGVLDEAGSERAILLGHAEGAAAALAAAVLRPDRVAGLVLLGAPAGVRPEEPLPDAAHIRREWGGPVLARELAPSAASDARFAELWSTLLRMGSSPALVAAMIARFPDIDACALAPWVQQKVIVVHRRGDRRAPLAGAERLHHALGERSRLLVTEGADHALFVGDSAPLVAACRELLQEPPSVPARGPVTIALAVRGDADEPAVRRALAAPGTLMRAASVTEALARAERAVAKAGQRGLSLAAGIGVGASLEDAGARAGAALARVERGIALDEVASCLASPRRGGEEPETD